MTLRFLDEFPDYCSLLLSGPPGVGKLEYMLRALWTHLDGKQRTLFVCIDVSPKEILDYLRKAGHDVSSQLGRHLIFIDCFTPSVSEEVDAQDKNVLPVSSFSNLEGIGMAITRGAERLQPPVKVLFYTISTLFLHNSSQSLSKFIQIVSSRVKIQMGMILYACHEGVHEERQEQLQRSLVDGVLEMRFGDSMTREIRLHHLRGHQVEPQWLPVVTATEREVTVETEKLWSVDKGGDEG